jgi:delta8-fatty-acid desaturase
MKALSTDGYHDLPYMTQDEARHLCSNEHRLLIAIENYWYDVSRFSRVHPGGEEVLQHFIADDATQPFLALHSVRVLRALHPIARYCRRPLHLADYEFERLAIDIRQSGMCQTSLPYMIHQSLIILICFLLFLTCLVQYSRVYIQFIGTFFLYLFFQQSLLTMHNAEHRLLTYNRHIDSHLGRIVGSLFSGVSARWWRDEHFLHHLITNVFDVKYNYFDRQMKEDAWAQTIHLFPCYRQSIVRFIIPYQKWILYPLCTIFGRLTICTKSILYSNNTRIDRIMLVLHWIWLWTLLLVYLPTWQYALLFLAIAGWFEGILHIILVTSHYACDTHDYTQFKEIGW